MRQEDSSAELMIDHFTSQKQMIVVKSYWQSTLISMYLTLVKSSIRVQLKIFDTIEINKIRMQDCP